MSLVILDADDVLLDFMPGFDRYVRSLGFNPDPAGPGQFDLSPWLGVDRLTAAKTIHDFIHYDDTGFDRLDAIPGAQQALERLQEVGHRVVVVSSFSDDPRILARRRDNIERLFGHEVFDDIIGLPLGSPKSSVLSRLPHAPFVDDLPRNVIAAREIGHHGILMRAHHNGDAFAPGVHGDLLKCDSWQDVMRIIDMQNPGNTPSSPVSPP